MKTEIGTGPDIPNILIVDDISANLKLLGDILKDEAYKIRQVNNGELALQVAEQQKPDLILLDIMMPGMDGYEVCGKLKKNPELKDIPVIFISALDGTNDIVSALALGGADYISKPFQGEEVKARIRTHLQIHLQSRELQRLNATKDKFFSIIAHDLRGPFSGFLGLTQLLAEESPNYSPDHIQKIGILMNSSATNLFRLLENLLEWSSMQRGLIAIIRVDSDLLTIVRECCSILVESFKSKEVELIYDIPTGLIISADLNMLMTIIRNLTTNALKFSNRGGTITISATSNVDNIEISVKDTGIGMDPELVSQLFGIDTKTARRGTEGEPSCGLGLLLVKDFIGKHGGEIWVESEVGQGSVFTFAIPHKNSTAD
jgi:signal transduction histidine kinase